MGYKVNQTKETLELELSRKLAEAGLIIEINPDDEEESENADEEEEN